MSEDNEFDFGKELDEDYIGVGGETGSETTSDLARDAYRSTPSDPSEADELCRNVAEANGERSDASENGTDSEERLSDTKEAYREGKDFCGTPLRDIEEAYLGDSVAEASDAVEAPDGTHRFDVGHGNGSGDRLDDVIDQNAIIDHDGRANTNTFFYAWEAPEEKEYQFSRMLRWNEGEGSPDRSINNRQADRNRYVDTVCGQLDMSDYHKERVKHLCGSVNMSHMGPRSSQETILSVVTIVANEDNRFVRDEELFRDLVTAIDSSLDTIKKLRKLLHEKSPEL